MKELNSYLIEKLVIGQNIKSNKYLNAIQKIENAFKYAGYEPGKRTENIGYLNKDDTLDGKNNSKYIEFNLVYKVEEPYLSLRFIIYNEGEDKNPSIHCRLFYNSKVGINPHARAMQYVIKYSSEYSGHSIFLQDRKPDKEYHECTPEVLDKTIKGIKDLSYNKKEFIDAITKKKFTENRWNNLCETCKYLFEI